jgi:hypothetical protein
MSNYATLAEVKSALRITDAIDDALLNTAISAASRFVDSYCDRSFSKSTAVRDYVPTGRMDALIVDDVSVVTAVKIDEDLDRTFGTTLRPIDFQLEPVNQRAAGQGDWPYVRIRPQEEGYWPIALERRATVRVEGTFGWDAIPDPVREATILQASRLFTRLDSPLGIAGFGDMGGMRVSFKGDPDVMMLLAAFRRVRF